MKQTRKSRLHGRLGARTCLHGRSMVPQPTRRSACSHSAVMVQHYSTAAPLPSRPAHMAVPLRAPARGGKRLVTGASRFRLSVTRSPQNKKKHRRASLPPLVHRRRRPPRYSVAGTRAFPLFFFYRFLVALLHLANSL